MPTARQTEILQFVARLKRELGHDPVIVEINAALGKNVTKVLVLLEGKGLLEFGETEVTGGVKITSRAVSELSPQQREAQSAVLALRAELGSAPRPIEVAERMGLSRQHAWNLLVALVDRRVAKFETKPQRGPVTITKEGKKWL